MSDIDTGLEHLQENPETSEDEDKSMKISDLGLSTGVVSADLNVDLPIHRDEGLNPPVSDSTPQIPQPTLLTQPNNNTEASLFSQDSSSILEAILNEMKLLRVSVDLLRQEFVDLKQQEYASHLTQTPVDNVGQKRKQIRTNIPKRKTLDTQSRSKKTDFNAVSYLQDNGEEKLQEELNKKTDTELKQVLRSEGMKTGKDLKTIEREEMIQEIISNTKRRLKHGSAFLQE